MLMRMYPGLLEGDVAIDERKVAARCYSEGVEVTKMLMELDAMHIVHYRPRPKGPQIYFLSERIDENLIQPSSEHYELLKEAARQRMEAMMKYVTCDDVCRSRQLVAWFGEQASTDCGLCDVCLKGVQPGVTTEEAVVAMLEKNAMSPSDLVEMMDNEGYREVGDTLRDMLDKGLIVLTSENTLRLAR